MLSRRSMHSNCSDKSPLRRPVRRPSVDGSVGCERETELLNSQFQDSNISNISDDFSCSSGDSEDFDDDATQVTSNQASVGSKKLLGPDSNHTKGTATTAKSSGLYGCGGDHQNTKATQTPSRWSGQVSQISFEFDGQASFELDDHHDSAEEADDMVAVQSNLSSPLLTEERIRSFMVDYYEDFHSIFQTHRNSNALTKKDCFTAFCEQYYTPDFRFIRPSGNPLDKAGFIKVNSEDIVGIRIQLVSIESIQIMAGGLAAAVVYTADQEFEYKGHPNSDRTVITSFLHATPSVIQIGHEHRCVGKPIPKATRWESSCAQRPSPKERRVSFAA